MKTKRPTWFGILLLCLSAACETTDPASLTIVNPAYQAPPATPAIRLQGASAPAATSERHPLQIEAMRAREYPGSEIAIERALEPGANYSRYYVSYLSDGLKIYALMTVPDGPAPPSGWPVVVFNHGYIPPDVYRTTERYVNYVDQIARHGYIVFRSDYRGHDRSEGEAGGAYSSPNYTVDVLNALASVRRYPAADPDRIGMWGHSMGGYITLRAMAVSREIKAGVIWGGVVAPYPDLFTRWNPGGAYSAPAPGSYVYALEAQYGTAESNPGFWNSISANAYLRDLNGPVQLHHGGADEEVPPAFSQMLYDEMGAAGQAAELYIYPGDNHNISNSFTQAMDRSVQFFDRYLK